MPYEYYCCDWLAERMRNAISPDPTQGNSDQSQIKMRRIQARRNNYFIFSLSVIEICCNLQAFSLT